MFPWMREHIAEAWHSRKSSRTAERPSLDVSTDEAKNSDRFSSNDTLMPPSATSNTFSVNIISSEGSVAPITVRSDFSIENMKATATKHFYGQDSSKPASNFRLIHAAKMKQLVDDKLLREEGVNELDELLLVEIRKPNPNESLADDAMKGPTKEEIIKVTSNLPLRNLPRPPPPVDSPVDFQMEIRKILLTLVRASARVLMLSSEANKCYEIVKEKLEARYKPLNDPKAVKNLTEMGFSERKVLKALRIKKMNLSEALEWLIEHEEDSSDEEMELSSLRMDIDLESAGPSSSGASSSVKKKTFKDACISLFKREGGQNAKKEPNLVNIVELLLESCRQYKKMDFKPNSQLVKTLREMGFEEKEIIEALRITGNNQANACAWLLGERSKNLQDLDEGLDPEGPVYEAIMSNSHVRLSLNSPKMLIAYLTMLDTPSSTNVWLNDPEVSPVLNHIFKTFASEKHAILMNSYNSS